MFKKVNWPSYISGYLIHDSVRSFNKLNGKINEQFQGLLSYVLKNVYIKIEQCFKMNWYNEEN